MRFLKYFLIFCCLFVYLLAGSIVRLALAFASPYTVTKAMNRMTYCLMHLFKLIGNLKINIQGRENIINGKGLFIVSPHVGYIDAIVLGTLLPGSFTTKNEVRKTPFLGNVVAIGDSIFIDRNKKNNIVDYVDVMADRLRHNINIFNFPEGHATDGKKILPFFPSFFNAPLRTKAPILPITIDYNKVNGNSAYNRDEIYCYDGKIPMLKHLLNLLKFKRIDITVTIHEIIQPNGHPVNSKSRNDISNLCMNRLSSYKNLPIAREHPFQKSTL